jgi:organic radical activating enzyme
VFDGYVSEIFASFQGEGLFAGRRHVFLRMAGCNLRCVYCDTPESLEHTPECHVYENDGSEKRLPNPLSVAQVCGLLSGFLESRTGVHAVAITGGEPLVQSSFLADLLRTISSPVPVLLETNGTYPQRLEVLLPFVQIISMDVKLPSNSGEPALWAEHQDFLLRGREKLVYVKVPVDQQTSEEEVREAARLVAEVKPDCAFFLQPIVSPSVEMQISASRLERFYDVAAAHLDDVRVLPQTHKVLGVR